MKFNSKKQESNLINIGDIDHMVNRNLGNHWPANFPTQRECASNKRMNVRETEE